MNILLDNFMEVASIILFAIGLFGVLTRRSAIGILMSIELMFNAVNINFVAFNRYITPADFTGQIFAIFTITPKVAIAIICRIIKINVNPNIKKTVLINAFFLAFSSVSSSFSVVPLINDIYEGINGNTQGDKNDNKPAINAELKKIISFIFLIYNFFKQLNNFR